MHSLAKVTLRRISWDPFSYNNMGKTRLDTLSAHLRHISSQRHTYFVYWNETGYLSINCQSWIICRSEKNYLLLINATEMGAKLLKVFLSIESVTAELNLLYILISWLCMTSLWSARRSTQLFRQLECHDGNQLHEWTRHGRLRSRAESHQVLTTTTTNFEEHPIRLADLN